ncbi:succinylglutamate desuccinylase/aspartoacylase family protein [Candidatus Peregrinibacteria bacterium]|nr:succinylglutamate desuccinylase/aspartoacylase family protein [Candidatus Peregrinibacteria bacterium]
MKKNRPTISIIGSIHGNEKIGALAINKLKKLIKKEEVFGEIHFIFGNPYAYKKNKRFLRHDMNRLFKSTGVELGTRPSLEQKRAEKIAKILKKTDFMLDIHSTQKPSVPFVYCKLAPRHLAFARIFETEFIVGPANNAKIPSLSACTDDYVNAHGGIGITYESGWNRDLKILGKVIRKTKEFLGATGVSFLKIKTRAKRNNPIIIELYKEVIPKTNAFSLAKDFKNFDFLQKGGAVARDNEQQIAVKQDSYIIFPKTQFIVGKPACYLGRSVGV